MKAIIGILPESMEIILTENEDITEYASDCIDVLNSYKDTPVLCVIMLAITVSKASEITKRALGG